VERVSQGWLKLEVLIEVPGLFIEGVDQQDPDPDLFCDRGGAQDRITQQRGTEARPAVTPRPVDLPAPFSPTNACTVPVLIRRSTPRSAGERP